MLKSVSHNSIVWTSKILGERALLLENSKVKIDEVHTFRQAILEADISSISEVIPSYKSLAILFKQPFSHSTLIEELDTLEAVVNELSNVEPINIEVDYEQGLDWDRVESHLQLTKEEIIHIHTSGTYTIAMIGFVPGFIFLDGLSKQIGVPRLESPRTHIPTGSVGIGGNQTGIYSMESPGGWNIIGRTNHQIFDAYATPPISLQPRQVIKFSAA